MAGRTARVELLAPAGEPRALRAALAAGADAVYFGLERWSARAYAGNFDAAGAVAAVEAAHRHGARACLALNVSLRDDELGPALAALEAPYEAGLDALIVADLGFAARVREAYPDLPLHASTQLGSHSSGQLALLARLGFTRAVLARELSLAEIAALDAHGLELEVFVHGALCYAWSGDCLLASMVGGRSGNRGRCSQACRLRYRLEGDLEGEAPPGRLLSTADLAAIDLLPDLIAAGVTALKVEGRMKDARYVAVATAVYREALDAALADPAGYRVEPRWRELLEETFSRGFTTAHLRGRHDEVRSGGRGGHRGVVVGRVAAVRRDAGTASVRLERPLRTGDVVCFYTRRGQSPPLRVAADASGEATLPATADVAPRDRLVRLTSAEVEAFAAGLLSGRETLRPVSLQGRFSATGAGQPAVLTLTVADEGVSVTVASAAARAARSRPLDAGRVRAALAALGGTPYRLAHLEVDLAPGLHLPVAELKDLRRRAVAALDERRLAARRRPAACRAGTTAPVAAAAGAGGRPPRAPDWPRLLLVVRPGEEPVAAPGVDGLCLDVERGDDPAQVAAAAAALRGRGRHLRLRLPEVLLDGDVPWLEALLEVGWDAVQARHGGVPVMLAARGWPAPYVTEYPLTGLDGEAAAALSRALGMAPAAVVAPPELSLAQLPRFAAALPGSRVECVVYGRQQVMRARDRLGVAEGLVAPPPPGEERRLAVVDAKGYRFPVTVTHDGTRVWNSRVTNLAAHLAALRAAGVATAHVVQRDLAARERRAFAREGLAALARLHDPERHTTGHLFRGVA